MDIKDTVSMSEQSYNIPREMPVEPHLNQDSYFVSTAECISLKPGLENETSFCSGEISADQSSSQPAAEEGEVVYQQSENTAPEVVQETKAASPKSDVKPSPISTRPKRARKRRHSGSAKKIPCTICGCNLKHSEVDGHIQTEIYRLEKAARNARNKYTGDVQSCIHDSRPEQKADNSRVLPEPVPGTSQEPDDIVPCESPEPWLDSPARYKSYLRVKTNRERRSARRRKRPNEEETTCPVCNQQIIGPQEEIADHVDACLRSSEMSVDVVGDEAEDDFTYEEYTWAGQTRIRTSTMLPGGLGAAGFQVNKKSRDDEDEDLELDVEGDDDVAFGTDQYTEADLMPCDTDAGGQRQRSGQGNASSGAGDGASTFGLATPSSIGSINTGPGKSLNEQNCDIVNTANVGGPGAQQIIEALKDKIREQAKQINEMADIPKCLICMERFTKPVTSVQCWHVHCENCWLKTLGAKKLCPQCNMITSPGDLRRIYL